MIGPEDYLKMHVYLLASVSDTLFAIAILLGANLLWSVLVVAVPAVRYSYRVWKWNREAAREIRRGALDTSRDMR